MKIQKWVMFSLLMILISAMVIAEADFTAQVNDLKAQVEGKELTGLAAKLFANDNINIYIKMESGQQQVIGVVTKDKKIFSVNMGAVEKPSLKIYTDDKTVVEIQSAASSVGALQSALREKKITYEAVGFLNKIKFAFISTFARMGSQDVKEVQSAEVKKEEVKAEDVKSEAVKKEEVKQEDVKKEEVKQEVKKEEPKVVVGETKDKVEVIDAVKPEVKPEEIKKPEMVKENPATVNVVIPAETKSNSVVHTISIKKDGFAPTSLTIKVGDTVEWKNERDSAASLNKAMIVGTKLCTKIQSKILKSGEVFKWTFEKKQACVFADGIDTMKTMTVTVE